MLNLGQFHRPHTSAAPAVLPTDKPMAAAPPKTDPRDKILPMAPPTLVVPAIREPIRERPEKSSREMVEITDVPLPPGGTARGYGTMLAPDATAAAPPRAKPAPPETR